MTRSGYTLPVFACAGAVAALHWLRHRQALPVASVDLITPAQVAEIPIEQVAGLSAEMALAMTRSDPGDNLDLTKNTPVWALVSWGGDGEQQITIQGGEGVGKQVNAEHRPAIYGYARQLLQANLSPLLAVDERITVKIILPEGRSLAERTSNAAFGVVEGLSLLGTSGISQPLSTPEQLHSFRTQLQQKASQFTSLVFCIGENGLDLAAKIGINPDRLIKTANWLGPMLVEAELLDVQEILLFGYHGKLMKLAGGIFHTHHHLADGRREVLTSHCALAGLNKAEMEIVFHSPTAEAALQHLRALDSATGSDWVNQVYSAIATTIDARCQEYLRSHSSKEAVNTVCGSILFDRDRKIIVKSKTACNLISNLC